MIAHNMWVVMMNGAAAVIAALGCISVAAQAETPPRWEASGSIREAEIIAVAVGPVHGRFVSTAEVFARGAPATIRRYTLLNTIHGDLAPGSQIVVVQSPSHLHGYVNLMPGESLFFLKRMARADVERIREGAPEWTDVLPEELWTFVQVEDQWMSAVQISTSINERIVGSPTGILVGQLGQHAGVEPTKDSIVAYIEGLVELRTSVLENQPAPAAETLDVFQQDVVRAATAEREERERVRQEAERQAD